VTSPVRRDKTYSPARIAPSSGAAAAVISAITVAALYFGREVFIPVALAILLSFVLAPIVLLLRRARAGRVPSVLIAVLFACLVIFGIAALIGGQVAQLAQNLPEYQATITHKIQSLQDTATGSGIIGRASSMLSNLRKEITRASEKASESATNTTGSPVANSEPQKPIPVEIHSPPAAPLEVIRSMVGPLSIPLATAGIVIVFLVFILLQREDLRDRFIRLVGGQDLQRTTQALDDGVSRLSRFFLVQSAINAGFGMVIGVGLFFIGVPNPVLWGVLAMLLRFLPYIGAWIAALCPAALALAVDPGWSMLLWTIALFAVVEFITGQAVEPLLNARSTGLSAVAVVVAATFWTWLWGPVGLLLSTPLTVCLVVLGRHVERLQFLDVLLGDQPALSREESFYQRILAGDPDEAAQQAEEFLKEGSLCDYYDQVAIRGLVLAQADVNRGALDHERRVEIKETIRELMDNLSNHDAVPGGVAGERPAQLPSSPPTTVLCVAGRGSLDEAAAAMMAQVLGKRGIGARVVPSHEVSAAKIFQLDPLDVKTVCVSYLEPGGLANARYLVRRLRRRLPEARIMLGLWTRTQIEVDHNALRETEADLVATSLAQAVELIPPEG
jgi:predicted PurR-regulated permease PerM